MTEMLTESGVDQVVRDRLGSRHHEVLEALLAGELPAGFEPRTTRVTGLVLRRKRWRSAASVFPMLRRQPGAMDTFDRYACERRSSGCAHTDVAAFLAWARAAGWRPAAGLERCWQVERGTRRTALARIGGRSVLLVGIGPWVYEFPPRADHHVGGARGGSRSHGGG